MFIPTQRIREVQTPRDLKGHRAQPPHVALKAAQFLHSPGGLPSPTRWGPNSLCASSTLHHVTGFISRPTAYPSTLHLHFRINKQCAFSRTHHASSNLQDSAVTSLGHTSTPWTSTCSHVTTTAKNSLNLSGSIVALFSIIPWRFLCASDRECFSSCVNLCCLYVFFHRKVSCLKGGTIYHSFCHLCI